ncbi:MULTISPECIES: Rad52/Rad22 family DNA repair protein [Arthrobacter]|uniref:Recombinase n=1 Tax=Arthrobacter terricola TaxID=2547396 RepID=A0A4R5KJD1_9MICC|nr:MULTISPECIES: Rad52/Rad22 family DNA repair protein [Arthrobacter]MBT8161430.1 hypothetical protein [Arthrobacter sp. GN70]TDF95603.1 recombinase [Arthrobacter terricola]
MNGDPQDKQPKLELLRAPFEPSDIDWRVQRSGIKDNKGWVQATAYIDNRAVQNRLDDVCGAENWKNEYKPGPAGGVIAGISIKLNGEWITKWDGADNTDVEAVKGGLSDSMKRAAVQWGIGRYLYSVESLYATVGPNGDYHIKIWAYGANRKTDQPKVVGYWSAPKLPARALPVRISAAEPQVKSSAAALLNVETVPEEPLEDAPTGAQIIQIRAKWIAAGGKDVKARDEWVKVIKTKAQAEQAIRQLDAKIERRTAEQEDAS